MKVRISWGILLWAGFLILVTLDCRNLKYLPNLTKELKKLCKKYRGHSEDNDFILVPKPKQKEF